MRITWRPSRNDTSKVLPASAAPAAGPHQAVTPSIVRNAASTVSGEAATVLVDAKLSPGPAIWLSSTYETRLPR